MSEGNAKHRRKSSRIGILVSAKMKQEIEEVALGDETSVSEVIRRAWKLFKDANGKQEVGA